MDTAAPNLSDYLAELRRGVRLLALAAVIGALLGLVIWSRTSKDESRVASATVSVADLGHPIDLLIGSKEVRAFTVAPTVARLNSDSFDSSAVLGAEGVRSGASVAATGDEANHLITIRAVASDDASASAVLESAITRVRTLQRDALTQVYASLREATEGTRARLEALLTDIEDQLSVLPNDVPAADYLVASGLQTQADLDDAVELLATIDAAETSPTGGIQEIGEPTASASERSAGWLLNAAIGTFLGVVIALGFLILRRFTSSPTDSRSAVERCGVPCLAVTSDRQSEGNTHDLVAALQHILNDEELVAVAACDVSGHALEEITLFSGPRLRFVDVASEASSGDRVLLVVDRRTTEDELRALAFSTRSVGANPIGVILTGVAHRDITRARSR